MTDMMQDSPIRYVEAPNELQELIKEGLRAVHQRRLLEQEHERAMRVARIERWHELREKHRAMLPAMLQPYLVDKPEVYYDTFRIPVGDYGRESLEWDINIPGLAPIEVNIISSVSWDGAEERVINWKIFGYEVSAYVLDRWIFKGKHDLIDMTEILGLARARYLERAEIELAEQNESRISS